MFTCRKTAMQFHTRAELQAYIDNGYVVEESKKRAPRKSAVDAVKAETKSKEEDK